MSHIEPSARIETNVLDNTLRRKNKMAKKNWIASAIKHPGALTKYAKQRGATVAHLLAHPPAGASATTKRRINLARTLKGLRKGGKRRVPVPR